MRYFAILILLIGLVSSISNAREMRGTIYNATDGVVEWTPNDFSGFFLDFNKGVGAEDLRLNISEKHVDSGAAQYESLVQKMHFDHKDWGSYKVLCFLGEKYFAGYDSDARIALPWDGLKGGNLSKILMDTAERRTLTSNEVLPLAEDYSATLSDVEQGVKVSLFKGGSIKNTAIIQPPADYEYSTQVGISNATLIAIHIKSNVRLTPNSYYTVDGIFQVSERAKPVKLGDIYGKMKVGSIEDSRIVLVSTENLNLIRNSDVELIDDIWLKAANSSDSSNKVYVYKNLTGTVNNDLRGSVTNLGANEFTWSPRNFAGFFYDTNDDTGVEQLTIRPTNVNSASATLGDQSDAFGNRGIIYKTQAQHKNFKFKPWGSYYNISFMGKSYFAGYVKGLGLDDSLLRSKSKDPNLLSNEQLGKVLLDSGDSLKVISGASLQLKEGFSVKIYVDDTCNKTMLELYSNGNLTDKDYFSVPHTYMYTNDLGNSRNIVVVALHISGVNCTQSKTCIVDGIYQISNSTIPLNINQQYGKMSIRNINPSDMTIYMDNRGNPIFLMKNKDIPLMGKIHIKTANQQIIDNAYPLRYYIYSEEL